MSPATPWTARLVGHAIAPKPFQPMPTRKYRILNLETNCDQTVGGSHQGLFDLVVNLDPDQFEAVPAFYQDNVFAERLRGLGYDVQVLTDMIESEQATRRRAGGLRKLADMLFWSPWRRVRFLKAHRIDLVHINNSPLVGMDDWLPAAKLARVPCVAYAMGDAHLAPTWKSRLLLRLYDRVIPISKHIARGMTRLGVPPSRQELVYLGVDLEGFRNQAECGGSIRSELGLAPETRLAVMVGNIRPWKGQHVVLEGLKLLGPELLETLHVAFVGGVGPAFEAYFQELVRDVEKSGLAPRVSFLGHRQDVPALFKAADFAIHASIIPEPLGLVVIESLAVGTPVIAGDKGGPTETITPDCGLLWNTSVPQELADAIEKLLTDPSERERLSLNAPARANQFGVDRNVQGVQGVYRRLLRA